MDAGRRPAPASSFTPILKPLEPFRDSLVVVSNLTRAHPGVDDGDHAVSAAGWLTGVLAEAHRSGGRAAPARRSIRSSPSRSARTRRSRRSNSPPKTSPATSAPAPRLQLRLHEHDLVELADHAAADGDQSAGGVRAAVRPAGHPARARARGAGATAASSTRRRRRPARSAASGSGRAIASGSASISTTSARSSGASSARKRATAREITTPDAPVGVPESFEEHVGADVRPAGGRLSGRPDARLHVHDGARAQPADLSADRRHRAAPHRLASRQRPGEDRQGRPRSTPITSSCSRSSSRSCARRPTATARCSITR